MITIGWLAGCAKQEGSDTPRITEKTFTLTEATVPVELDALAGQLSGLTVMQRVNAETGEVVHAPQLRGTLKLKNTSDDRAIRLLAGELEYLDTAGVLIPVAEGREKPAFKFYGYSGDRLDPGAEFSQSVEVTFPKAALEQRPLAQVRLNLTYIPTPFREESVTVPLKVGDRG
jgi:hypothetical protein